MNRTYIRTAQFNSPRPCVEGRAQSRSRTSIPSSRSESCSTLAVTATGAIIFAAAEEFGDTRRRLGLAEQQQHEEEEERQW